MTKRSRIAEDLLMVFLHLMLLIVLLTAAFGAPRDDPEGYYGRGLLGSWHLIEYGRHWHVTVNMRYFLRFTVQNY